MRYSIMTYTNENENNKEMQAAAFNTRTEAESYVNLLIDNFLTEYGTDCRQGKQHNYELYYFNDYCGYIDIVSM